MKTLAVVAGFVAGVIVGRWWEITRPIPLTPAKAWPDRFDLFPQRNRR